MVVFFLVIQNKKIKAWIGFDCSKFALVNFGQFWSNLVNFGQIWSKTCFDQI